MKNLNDAGRRDEFNLAIQMENANTNETLISAKTQQY